MTLYVLWFSLFVGFRTDHYYIVAGLTFMFFATEKTHKIICGIIFFLLFAAIYDSLRLVPPYTIMPVHIEDLYMAEKNWFGINVNNEILTPNEYLLNYLHPILDVISGVSYLSWMPFPIGIGAWLAIKRPKHLMLFSFCFLFSNFIGISLYYLFPAAPPWYVYEHGFEFIPQAGGNPSVLLRFDQLINMSIFQGIYGKSSNVFGAIPSMHAAYPLITTYYLLKYRYTKMAIISILLMLGIWFGAIYGMQHYIIDVLLGISCAVVAIFLCEKIIYKTQFKKSLFRLASYIS